MSSGLKADALGVYNNETAPGTKVELWPSNGGTNQKSTSESNGTIVGQQSGLCLDVAGAKPLGHPVQIWTCNGGANQKSSRGVPLKGSLWSARPT